MVTVPPQRTRSQLHFSENKHKNRLKQPLLKQSQGGFLTTELEKGCGLK